MILKRVKPTNASRPTRGIAGMNFILLGLVCFVVGMAVDGGFFRGLFLGATVALMVLGAYVVGASRKRRPGSAGVPPEGGPWLPSRDATSDPAER